MTMTARFLPQYPKRINVTDGLTKNEANGVVTLGFDYDESEMGAELAQAVATTNANAGLTAADRVATAADRAAAEAAASVAANATSSFATRADAIAASYDAGTLFVVTQGYGAVGDGGAAVYKKVGTEPDNAGKFQSADGKWWELSNSIVNQYMFGAVGNGTVDDTAAIHNLVAFAEGNGRSIMASPGIHKVTATIVLMKSADFSACAFFADATSVSPVVQLGAKDYTSSFLQTYRCPKIVNAAKYAISSTGFQGFAKTSTGWGTFSSAIGIEAATLNNCYISLDYIAGFGVGFSGGGYGSNGFAYNRLWVNYLLNNKINFRLRPGDTTGWANENTIYGGRYDFDNDEGSSIDNCHGIRLDAPTGNDNVPNNNLFVQPAFEATPPAYCIWINGTRNKFLNPRFDGAKKYVGITSRTVGESSYNEFHGGYGVENPDLFQIDYYGERSYGNAIVCGRFISAEGVYNGPALALTNPFGEGLSYPHLVGFNSSVATSDKRNFATGTGIDWNYGLYSSGFSGKRFADTDIRVGFDWANGNVMLGDGSGTKITLGYTNSGSAAALTVNCHVFPTSDNAYQLGWSSERFSVVYAATGTIQTSDAREKEWRGGLNDAEMKVARRLSSLIGIYRWKESIERKGPAARLHAGVLAQFVQEAFKAEGLDGFAYGVLCYDKWDERQAVVGEGGKEIEPALSSGDRFGIRYDELWAFVAAGMDARIAALEAAK